MSENKQNKQKNEKKKEQFNQKTISNKKSPTTQMMRSLDIEERGTSHFCI
jgi:hypothetical protein